jgi:hypothetical protein
MGGVGISLTYSKPQHLLEVSDYIKQNFGEGDKAINFPTA